MICDDGVIAPRRSTKGSAGYDFHAPHDIPLTPGEWTDIDTGVRLTDDDIPEGVRCFLLLAPRSGLGVKYGVRFRNTVGIIDSDYRDNMRACMTSDVPVTIRKGERFMQGVLVPYMTFQNEIEPTECRNGGHGSTGL